jgi:hypothetical protein
MLARTVIIGGALALIVTPAATQELTLFQRQVLDGAKKTLVESVQKQHANCDSSNICETMRVDILDEVLEHWENTPPYGKYAVDGTITSLCTVAWTPDLKTN